MHEAVDKQLSFRRFCLFGVEYKIMFKELINLFIVFVIVNFLLSLICMIITKAFIISFKCL